MQICGLEPPARSRGGKSPWWVVKNILKLKNFELVDTQLRGKSAKCWIFWTRSSAHFEVDSTVFAIFCKIL